MKVMTNHKIFFADTYAFIEILNGNPNYKPYLNSILVTSRFNLIEFYYHLLNDKDKKTADKYLEVYSSLLIPITNKSIRIGMQFKLKHKKEKLSYTDCIGYAQALELNVRFLTGDQKFENKDNVEFVK